MAEGTVAWWSRSNRAEKVPQGTRSSLRLPRFQVQFRASAWTLMFLRAKKLPRVTS